MQWLIITRRNPSFDPAHLPAHYQFLEDLRSDGLLSLSGPFDDDLGGAYLVTAPSRTVAEAIATRDPLHVHGSSSFDLRGWKVRERV